jgi:hypothetical protein
MILWYDLKNQVIDEGGPTGTGSRHSEKNDRSAVNPGADRPGERRLTAAEPSEVLIWEMQAGLGPATR